jgi:hypothetical protein
VVAVAAVQAAAADLGEVDRDWPMAVAARAAAAMAAVPAAARAAEATVAAERVAVERAAAALEEAKAGVSAVALRAGVRA